MLFIVWYIDRNNVTNLLYLVLHLAHKVTCYFRLFSLVLVSVLRTSINVLSKSKSKNYVTWIANLTKLFLSVWTLCHIPCGLSLMDNPSSMDLTVFFFLDIRNYWWYDKCLRGYSQFSNGECPDVWSSRRSGCIHSIDYESLFANDHCKCDTSRYTNSLNNTNLSKTIF